MKEIKININSDEILNNFTIEEIIEFYGCSDVLDHIPVKTVVESYDTDELMTEIDNMHEDHVKNYVTEKYNIRKIIHEEQPE
jgi:hypothetical protein